MDPVAAVQFCPPPPKEKGGETLPKRELSQEGYHIVNKLLARGEDVRLIGSADGVKILSDHPKLEYVDKINKSAQIMLEKHN